MTRVRTVEATTAHGTVRYDVVTCAHCRAEVVPEDAVPVGIGAETYTCSGLPICRARHERPAELRCLCAYCAAELLDYGGPPDGVRDRLDELAEDASALWLGFWLGTVLAVTVATTAVLLHLFGLV